MTGKSPLKRSLRLLIKKLYTFTKKRHTIMANSIFPAPSTIFVGVSTNWNQALVYVKQMSSYLRRVNACDNCNKGVNDELAKINFILTAISYDGPDDLNNVADWQDGIKSAYYLLYPLTV